VVEYLVNQRADINAKDENDWTPLHFAAQNIHLSVVEYLVNHKAEINAKDNKGITPLDLSRIHKEPDVYEFLMRENQNSFNLEVKSQISLSDNDNYKNLASI